MAYVDATSSQPDLLFLTSDAAAFEIEPFAMAIELCSTEVKDEIAVAKL